MGTAYVANYASKSISIICTTKHALKGTIKLPYSPYAMAPPTRYNQLWVLMGSNYLGVIDLIHHKLIGSIKIPHRATAVALTPDATRAYVTNWEGETGFLTIINAFTRKIIKNLTLEFTFPVDVAVAPDGKKVYVVSSEPAGLIVVNQSTNQMVTEIETECYSNKVAINAKSTRAYVTNSDECHSVSVENLITNSQIKNIQLPTEYPGYIAITPDQKYAYITHEPYDKVTVINLLTNTVLKVFTCLGAPSGIAMTPDNKYAYIVQHDKNRVAVLRRSTGTFIKTINVGHSPDPIVITAKSLP